MPNTREKLVELLALWMHIKPHEERMVRLPDAERLADYLIANGVTVQKWIPVTERLPEPRVTVLCWYEYFRFGSYNRMFQTYGIGYYFRDGMWGGEVSNGLKARVLAWMPLPKLPKEV